MSQTVLVFVKQVPDTQNITGDAMTPAGTVNRAALPAIFNPEDLNALELALQLKDRYGVKVVVGTMGPPAAADSNNNPTNLITDLGIKWVNMYKAFHTKADTYYMSLNIILLLLLID